MKNNFSLLILLLLDLLAIIIAVSLAFTLRLTFDAQFDTSFSHNLSEYLTHPIFYLIIFLTLFYEEIYTKRYDFWHESRQIIKALLLSFLLVMSYLALSKEVDHFSRAILLLSFIFMTFLLPLFKNITKKQLFKLGLWQRQAKIYGDDDFISREIFSNPYLGYIHSSQKSAQTVFINSKDLEPTKLRQVIDTEIHLHHELIFIPLINDYNMTESHIYELSNTRTNLVVFKNRLKSKYRILLQQGFNYFLALCLLPVLLPIIAILSILIKRESPGPIFFSHNRIGQNGKNVPTLKFRSMYSDAQERLKKLLESDDTIKKEWESNFKLKDDPRVTKLGAFMRKTSLDELPQIFNVLKGEMNFVGPRPVIQKEIDQYYKADAEYYLMVKPGITGLWQVSGRSDTDYHFRVKTDKWYVSNWSLWLDIVILFKTIKVVLFKEGAY